MPDLSKRYEDDCSIVTYEAMIADPASAAVRLSRFLGVADDSAIAAECTARAAFPAASAGDGSFFRKGIAGDWRSTLTPAMSDLILDDLGWMFPVFGWTP